MIMKPVAAVAMAVVLGVGLGMMGFITFNNNNTMKTTMTPTQLASESAESGNAEGAQMKVIDKAPDFKLKDLTGQEVVLSDLVGEKVYVKYWASWCSICLAGMEELNTLAGQDNGFRIITVVSPGKNGEQETDAFKDWFKSLAFKNITVLLDETGEVMEAYGVRAFPTSAYIASDGSLVKVLPGHVSNEDVVKAFENMK